MVSKAWPLHFWILPGGVMVSKAWPLHFWILPGGVMVTRVVLDHEFGVRVPAGQLRFQRQDRGL